MAFGLKFVRTGKDEVDRRVRRAAEILKLTNLLDRRPRDLSGGQRQRVAIGRAIVREPSVFLFDEPLSNLDAALRVNTRLEIAKLHRELRATMIYVTHDQVEAMTLASKIVVLNHGRVEQIGAPLELYRRPRNLFVAGFIGSPRMNFISARVRSVTEREAVLSFAGIEARMPLPGPGIRAGEAVTIGVRPEHMADPDPSAIRYRRTHRCDRAAGRGEPRLHEARGRNRRRRPGPGRHRGGAGGSVHGQPVGHLAPRLRRVRRGRAGSSGRPLKDDQRARC